MENTGFGSDTWCGNLSLKDKFSALFNIGNEQECSVQTVNP